MALRGLWQSACGATNDDRNRKNLLSLLCGLRGGSGLAQQRRLPMRASPRCVPVRLAVVVGH